MADGGIGEALIISALIGGAASIGGAAYAEGQRPKGTVLKIPPDPGKVPSFDQASSLLRQRKLRDLSTLRIESPPPSQGTTGLQIAPA